MPRHQATAHFGERRHSQKQGDEGGGCPHPAPQRGRAAALCRDTVAMGSSPATFSPISRAADPIQRGPAAGRGADTRHPPTPQRCPLRLLPGERAAAAPSPAQAGREAGREAGKEAGKEAGREAGREGGGRAGAVPAPGRRGPAMRRGRSPAALRRQPQHPGGKAPAASPEPAPTHTNVQNYSCALSLINISSSRCLAVYGRSLSTLSHISAPTGDQTHWGANRTSTSFPRQRGDAFRVKQRIYTGGMRPGSSARSQGNPSHRSPLRGDSALANSPWFWWAVSAG